MYHLRAAKLGAGLHLPFQYAFMVAEFADLLFQLLFHLGGGGRGRQIQTLAGIDIHLVNAGIGDLVDLLLVLDQETLEQERVRHPVAIQVMDIHPHLEIGHLYALDHSVLFSCRASAAMSPPFDQPASAGRLFQNQPGHRHLQVDPSAGSQIKINARPGALSAIRSQSQLNSAVRHRLSRGCKYCRAAGCGAASTRRRGQGRLLARRHGPPGVNGFNVYK